MPATESNSTAPTPDDIQWIPSSILNRANLPDLFPVQAPLTIDYGCGEGAFVLAMAQKHPERNFLATERLVGRVEKVCKTASRLGLRNIRVLRLENLYTARFLIPLESVAVSFVSRSLAKTRPPEPPPRPTGIPCRRPRDAGAWRRTQAQNGRPSLFPLDGEGHLRVLGLVPRGMAGGTRPSPHQLRSAFHRAGSSHLQNRSPKSRLSTRNAAPKCPRLADWRGATTGSAAGTRPHD